MNICTYIYIYMNICTHIYIYTLHKPNIAPENGGLEGLPASLLKGPCFQDASQSNSRASSSPCVSMKIVEKFVSFLQAPNWDIFQGYSPEN